MKRALLALLLVLPLMALADDFSSWKLSPDAFGPVHIGMTAAEITKATQKDLVKAKEGFIPGSELQLGKCEYMQFSENIEGVNLLMQEGKLVRIEVTNPKVTTDRGAHVGDSEKKIQSLYKKHLSNVEGNFLIFVPPHNPYGMMFEVVYFKKIPEINSIATGKVANAKYGCVVPNK